MALVELGRFQRTESEIIVGRLLAEGIGAVCLDAAMSPIFLGEARVMVDAADLVEAKAILAMPAPLPDF